MIPFPYVLRRRMMISGGGDAPFAFEYTGNYTDNRDANGIGTVEFTSSGTLTVLSGRATVSAYILGAGGGGSGASYYRYYAAGGGGGGNQTVEVDLAPGTYEIVIGTGGTGTTTSGAQAGNGGNTVAFGYTSTGGIGGKGGQSSAVAGTGGSPNGTNGGTAKGEYSIGHASGGSPNGGSAGGGIPGSSVYANSGGNGLVRLTFS